jgi:hypothetical protein
MRKQYCYILVCDSRCPASGDGGIFHQARWRLRKRRKTRAPAPAINSAAQRHPLANPTARWATRSWAALASAPPDRDNSAPLQGRLCPAFGSVDHRPCSRLLWLITTKAARGGEQGGATLRGGGGGGGSGCAGEGRRCNAAPPCILVAVW